MRKSQAVEVGDRVISTRIAHKCGVFKQYSTVYGRITGHPHDPRLIKVTIDGQSTPCNYSKSFWKLVSNG